MATTTQASATSLKWVAVQRPSRPTEPDEEAALGREQVAAQAEQAARDRTGRSPGVMRRVELRRSAARPPRRLSSSATCWRRPPQTSSHSSKIGLVGDRAAHAVAVLLAADDAGLGEHADVLGDVLLRGAERLGELVDGQRPVAQRVEQADAHRLADDAEALRDQLDERLRKRVRE